MAERPPLFTIPRKPVGVGIGLVVLVAALTALYHFVPTPYQGTIVFFGAALAAAGAIAGGFYTGHILALYLRHEETVREEARRREEREQKEIAFRYGERWNDPAMYYSRKVCRDIIAKRKEPEGINEELLANDDARTNANHILNFLDELALSVREGRADAEIAKRQFGGLVNHVSQALSVYMEQRVIDADRKEIWAELKWLNDQW